MCASYKDKQKRSHFVSFANKIFTGIKEIKSEYTEKRAVWELFQNALDTVEENGIIEIAKTNRGLLFRHNGRPFTDDEFGGLIKQFSVGKVYGDNTEKVGQYGTGFISTHIYGKTIIINGSIKTDDGSYRLLKDFTLDRDAESVDQLTDKLLVQDNLIEALCEDLQLSEPEPLTFTTFEYQSNPNNHVHIDAMLSYIKTILPFIFCFNDKLNEVRLSQDGTHDVYKSMGAKDGLMQLTKNGEPFNMPLLQSEDGSIKIILGSPTLKLNDVPKLFLYYPLMETIKTGINFLVHAREFKPNKERDYLYKSKDSEELQAEVLNNETMMKRAYDLILDKVSDDNTLHAMDTLNIVFTNSDSDFDRELKCSYINKVRNLEIVQIGEDRLAVDSLQYFEISILLLDDEEMQAFYNVLCQFRKLPSLEEYAKLGELVNNWNLHVQEKFSVFKLHDIGQIIVNESGGNYFYIKDTKSYQRVISVLEREASFLNQYALIPNIHGKFTTLGALVRWEEPEPNLVCVVDMIAATISEKYIHADFELLGNVNPYNRIAFKDDFSKYCNEFIEDLAKGRDAITLDSPRYSMLIKTLTEFIGLNKKTQLNIDVASFYERVYALQSLNFQFSDPTIDINYQPAIKLLGHLYIKSLRDVELIQHLSDLSEIVGAMFRNTNLREELLHRLACIPNQNLLLKSQTDLKLDQVLDGDFKDHYNVITGKNCRNELAYEGFGGFLQHTGSVSGSQLGEEIELALNREKKFIPVEESTIVTLIKLIEKISEKPITWGQWLPNINKVKEEILMHRFQKGKTRSSLFSILTKNEDIIEMLSDLAQVEDLADLIKKGKEKQQEDRRKNSHLTYINKIGLQIQDLIESQLGVELAQIVAVLQSDKDTKLITLEAQNGQDFIIYKNERPIYYLEVKSKWDENGRFALSKNQTEKCAEKKNEYAVISVNVDRYKRKNSISTEDVRFEDLKEFVKVNDNLGEQFEKLILENSTKVELADPKLIEFRGSIPQKLIDTQGSSFDSFIQNLIYKIKESQ